MIRRSNQVDNTCIKEMLIRGQAGQIKSGVNVAVDYSVDNVNFAAAHNNMHMIIAGCGVNL